ITRERSTNKRLLHRPVAQTAAFGVAADVEGLARTHRPSPAAAAPATGRPSGDYEVPGSPRFHSAEPTCTHRSSAPAEIARDYVRENTGFEVIGGYISPVSDGYKKKGLEAAAHRARMCTLAVESSPWLMVDEWECSNPEFVRSALVLDHFDAELNAEGGIRDLDGGKSTSGKIVPRVVRARAGRDTTGAYMGAH
ncbi:MAG: hypothetical protein BJ554DRAFT_6023, partial [Olpidium bornovanus]